MSLNASHFINKPNRKLAITNKRIGYIVWYVIECYLLLQKDNPKYSKTHIRKNTSYKFEDFLKMELVDKYLIQNKKLLQKKVSALDQINFTYETVKRYVDIDQREKSDKIDVYINKLGLRKEWKEDDENVYFAIECKRVKILSDTKFYVEDIQKFTNRDHIALRLPFEGMISFIENKKLSSENIIGEINNRLTAITAISTIQYLNASNYHINFNNSYKSIHQRIFSRDVFSIFHLMFDYSSNVVN